VFEEGRRLLFYIECGANSREETNMVNEQENTLEGFKTAIQMEIDGKEYYLKASQRSSNQTGKNLLISLAGEEDLHRRKFEEIFSSISASKDWPAVDFQPDGGKSLRTILAGATGGSIIKDDTELEAIQQAINMEIKTRDFYRERSKKAAYDAEKEFYEKVAMEEGEHHLVLVDYYEYLKDPAGWFVKTEHPTLDGG